MCTVTMNLKGTNMSDAQTKLGQLIDGDRNRDAVHIAVAPVIAAVELKAGMRIGLTSDGRAARVVNEIIGIVDPFLTTSIDPGDKFYMFLLPNTITDLKHVWTHPAFPEQAAQPTPIPEDEPTYDEDYDYCCGNDR